MKANILRTFRGLHQNESGQDMIEYALVGALVALGALAAVQSLGTAVNNAYTWIETTFTGAI